MSVPASHSWVALFFLLTNSWLYERPLCYSAVTRKSANTLNSINKQTGLISSLLAFALVVKAILWAKGGLETKWMRGFGAINHNKHTQHKTHFVFPLKSWKVSHKNLKKCLRAGLCCRQLKASGRPKGWYGSRAAFIYMKKNLKWI